MRRRSTSGCESSALQCSADFDGLADDPLPVGLAAGRRFRPGEVALIRSETVPVWQRQCLVEKLIPISRPGCHTVKEEDARERAFPPGLTRYALRRRGGVRSAA